MTANDKVKLANIKTILLQDVDDLETTIKLSKPFSDIDSMILQKRSQAQIDAYNKCLHLLTFL